uniref:Uncharacterized protein n=2 Tax=Oryza sativa subsp. japonica TaxID=39947 RepID=Q69QL6_ORYSJ|nr:hypothetical protein [Oryza sativa Japonica Group]
MSGCHVRTLSLPPPLPSSSLSLSYSSLLFSGQTGQWLRRRPPGRGARGGGDGGCDAGEGEGGGRSRMALTALRRLRPVRAGAAALGTEAETGPGAVEVDSADLEPRPALAPHPPSLRVLVVPPYLLPIRVRSPPAGGHGSKRAVRGVGSNGGAMHEDGEDQRHRHVTSSSARR